MGNKMNTKLHSSKHDIFNEDLYFALFLRNALGSESVRNLRQIWDGLLESSHRFLSSVLEFDLWGFVESQIDAISEKYPNKRRRDDYEDFNDFDGPPFMSGKHLNRIMSAKMIPPSESRKIKEKVTSVTFDKAIELLEQNFELDKADFAGERLAKMREFTLLDEHQMKTFVFFLTISFFPCFEGLLENMGAKTSGKFVAECIGLGFRDYNKATLTDGRLLRSNILIKDGNTFEVPNTFADYILGNSADFISKIARVKIPEDVFPIDSFKLPKMSKEIILSLLRAEKPCNILLYGKPGTGKTEFAKSIAFELGKKIVSTHNRENISLGDVIMAMKASERLKEITIIDECDNVLSGHLSSRPFMVNCKDKASVNNAFDEFLGKSIWITNNVEDIETSTLRRFDFSVKFDGIDDSSKLEAIKASIGSDSRFAGETNKILNLAKRYDLAPAGVAKLIEGAKAVSNSLGDELAFSAMTVIAKAQNSLLTSGENRKPYKADKRFDSSIINMDCDYDRLMNVLKNYSRKLEEEVIDCPMNLLFMGVAGAGKTELAKHIAEELGRPVLVKRMSSLLSKFVGESERNIAEAFAEAERTGAILVVDEADSLFASRENAEKQWEVSQTNEVLAQMESFNGILICSTNLVKRMDSAAMRRFHKKITFGYLKPDASAKLFKSYLLNGGEISPDIERRLSRLDNLTAGDFKNVAQQIAYESDEVCEEECLCLIEKESEIKAEVSGKRFVGFI